MELSPLGQEIKLKDYKTLEVYDIEQVRLYKRVQVRGPRITWESVYLVFLTTVLVYIFAAVIR